MIHLKSIQLKAFFLRSSLVVVSCRALSTQKLGKKILIYLQNAKAVILLVIAPPRLIDLSPCFHSLINLGWKREWFINIEWHHPQQKKFNSRLFFWFRWRNTSNQKWGLNCRYWGDLSATNELFPKNEHCWFSEPKWNFCDSKHSIVGYQTKIRIMETEKTDTFISYIFSMSKFDQFFVLH